MINYGEVGVLDTAYALTVLGFAIIVSRIVLRILNHETFKPDDYLILGATVFYVLNTAVTPIVVRHLAL